MYHGAHVDDARFALALGTRLAFAVVSVLVISSALLFVELTTREHESLIRSKQTAASIVADLFAASVSAPLDFADTDAIDADIREFAKSYDVVCAAVWNAHDSKPIAAFRDERCAELIGPKEEDLGTTIVLADRVEVSRVVTGPGGRLGRTLVVFSLRAENAAYDASRKRLFWLFFLLTTGTAILLITIVRRQVVSPVVQLANAARRVGMGDLKARVEVTSQDEIAELANAFNAMGQAIADREEQIAAATESLRELFNHMQQAILAFGADGKVDGEVSREAAKIFGKEALVGQDVRDLLYPNRTENDVDAQAFDEWLSVAFSIAPGEWAEVGELAPNEVAFSVGGRSTFLVTEFRPIVENGKLARVMLLATDVSEKKNLERVVRSQEEEYVRRIAAMRRLVAGGGQVFVTFLDGARERIERCETLVKNGASGMLKSEIDEVFRHIHTIKGEARAFDMRELEQESTTLEDKLTDLRNDARGVVSNVASVPDLLAHLGRVREGVNRAAEIFVAASPIGRAALDQISVLRSDVDALAALVRTEKGAFADRLVAIVERLAARPFGECTLSLIDSAPTWAASEGKQVQMEVDGRECRVPSKLSRVLPAVLTHLVRNSVAHGIELPNVRATLGKKAFGVVRLSAKDGVGGPEITVEDDGAGLDRGEIARRTTMTQGMDLAEIIFKPGFSTSAAAGGLAGRGVGLGAVRAELASVGYEIKVFSMPLQYTRVILSAVKKA
jgi:two-component system chemotaxis sensor kinase CheA